VDFVQAQGKALSSSTVIHVFCAVCQAVAAMHQQTPPLAHRCAEIPPPPGYLKFSSSTCNISYRRVTSLVSEVNRIVESTIKGRHPRRGREDAFPTSVCHSKHA